MTYLVRLPKKKQFSHEQHLLTVYGKSCNICCWRRNPVQRKQALYFVVLCCEVKLRTIFDCFYQKVTHNNRCSCINKVKHLLLDVFCQFKQVKSRVILRLTAKLLYPRTTSVPLCPTILGIFVPAQISCAGQGRRYGLFQFVPGQMSCLNYNQNTSTYTHKFLSVVGHLWQEK